MGLTRGTWDEIELVWWIVGPTTFNAWRGLFSYSKQTIV